MARILKIGRKKFILAFSVMVILLCAAILISLFPVRYIDEPYEYPIAPDSEEWAAMGSTKELYAALDVPHYSLRHMTTQALVDTILDYPMFASNFCAITTPSSTYAHLRRVFNAIRELERRSDAGRVLMETYRAIEIRDVDDWHESFRPLFLETMLGQKVFLEQMSPQDRADLAAIADAKYRQEQTVWLEKATVARHYSGTFYTAAEKSGYGGEFPRP